MLSTSQMTESGTATMAMPVILNPKRDQPGIGPASHLIAAAIDHVVDEVFRLVTILPFPSLRAFRTLGMTTQNIDQETTQDNCQIHTHTHHCRRSNQNQPGKVELKPATFLIR
jgi:hypothetical protein